MSFGIGDNPFKAFASNAEAGGGMGAYRRLGKGTNNKRGQKAKEEKEESKLLDTDFDDEDEPNYDLDMDDFSF